MIVVAVAVVDDAGVMNVAIVSVPCLHDFRPLYYSHHLSQDL